MRVKAIQNLSQLSDEDLFAEIETGAELCAFNAQRIHKDSLVLDELEQPAGAEILRLAAEEEAAKVLILLDAVRCSRIEHAPEFSRQLQYFNDHLAKGIYAQYTWRQPHSFADVREWIDRERKQFYLDGPNGVDWIFYNDILRRREETIYVDYVQNDDIHLWHDPRSLDDLGGSLASARNPTLRLVSALSDAGCLKSRALNLLARLWRQQPIEEALTTNLLFDLNVKTLETMNAAGLVLTQDQEVIDEIANRWLFPLYSLDLRKDGVNIDDLREIQRNWSPYENG
jgi:AbiV family abortive infection protein